MTPLEDQLRAALRATAASMPPAQPPPLTLPKRRRLPGPVPLRLWSGRGWATAVTAVFLIAAVVAGSLALASLVTRHPAPLAPAPAPPPSVLGVPGYYVALTSADGKTPSITPEITTATVRATATGKVLATIAVPKPYYSFTAVTAAADARTFVLAAESKQTTTKNTDIPNDSVPLGRFFLLHLDLTARTEAARVRLQALPASWIPDGSTVQSLALSADGTTLAAIIGPLVGNSLYVFHLPAGTEHVWSYSPCSRCAPGAIYGSSGLLSLTADGRTVAFVFDGRGATEGQVRLLDTSAPGPNLVADSKAAVNGPFGPYPYWAQAIITADGRSIMAVRLLISGGRVSSQQLVQFSAATGQLGAVRSQLPTGTKYDGETEQIQWSDRSGHELLISGTQQGAGAEILRGDQATPIPWPSHIFAAAW